jgi:hypothetical protein
MKGFAPNVENAKHFTGAKIFGREKNPQRRYTPTGVFHSLAVSAAYVYNPVRQRNFLLAFTLFSSL